MYEVWLFIAVIVNNTSAIKFLELVLSFDGCSESAMWLKYLPYLVDNRSAYNKSLCFLILFALPIAPVELFPPNVWFQLQLYRKIRCL